MNLHPIMKAVVSAVLALALGVPVVRGADAAPRGGRVGWARLITPGKAWNRHAEDDATLTTFIRRETSLNIDPTWFSADPADLAQLCAYPLIFTNNLVDVRQPAHLKNLQEYLRRGGFIFVDACTNTTITADPDVFLQEHIALMAKLVPGAQVRSLPPEHEIFRQYFAMTDTPPHVYYSNVYDPKFARHGLYGVFDGTSMVALLDVAGLQCGWSGAAGSSSAQKCMKMVVNIYVYAMTRAAEAVPRHP
jgi:hypothetical protein